MAAPSEDNFPIKTVSVPHLGGTKLGYRSANRIVGSKASLVLITSYLASANLYRPQFEDEQLSSNLNLIAFEPLGHGQSSTRSPTYTYWDSAVAIIQALDQLGIKKTFVLGNSQGGWIAARIALLAPERVLGIIPVSSHLGADDSTIQERGGIDLTADLKPMISQYSTSDDNFSLPAEFTKNIIEASFGTDGLSDSEFKSFQDIITKVYTGNAGRAKFLQSTINLISRDSLYYRLPAIVAPTLWIVGEKDAIFPEKVARADVELLTGSEARLEVIAGARHASTYTHAKEVNPLIFEFIKKYSGLKDARSLREAVGMVDI